MNRAQVIVIVMTLAVAAVLTLTAGCRVTGSGGHISNRDRIDRMRHNDPLTIYHELK